MRLFVFASLAGWPVAVLALTGVHNFTANRAAISGRGVDALAALLLAVVALLPALCLALRSGRRTRVTWDETGITEWENDSVRTFIARADAREASDVRTRVLRLSKSQRVEAKRSVVVQVSDRHGRRITVAWRDPLFRLGFGALPLWMRRRPVLTSLESVEALLAWLPPSVDPPVIEPDRRSAQRPMAAQSSMLHLAAVGLGGGAVYAMIALRNAEPASGAALIAAGLLLAVATLRPIGELRAVVRDARRVKGAQRIAFATAQDGGAQVVLADGCTLPAEIGDLDHADAIVHRRAGSAWAIVEVSASSDAYRDAPSRASVRRVDTDRERAERRRIVVANALEITARAAHALILVMAGALIVTKVASF